MLPALSMPTLRTASPAWCRQTKPPALGTIPRCDLAMGERDRFAVKHAHRAG